MVTSHRARLFEEEKQRQVDIYTFKKDSMIRFGFKWNTLKIKEIERIEKIEVKVQNRDEEVTLVMNKGLSTPYSCAMRI